MESEGSISHTSTSSGDPVGNAAAAASNQQAAEFGHILVVDDYPMNRLKLVRLLQQQGHSVAQAGDGEQALAMLKQQSFDVVLLDLLMPGIDGMEVMQTMKRDAALRDIPIIMISAVEEIDKAAACIEN